MYDTGSCRWILCTCSYDYYLRTRAAYRCVLCARFPSTPVVCYSDAAEQRRAGTYAVAVGACFPRRTDLSGALSDGIAYAGEAAGAIRRSCRPAAIKGSFVSAASSRRSAASGAASDDAGRGARSVRGLCPRRATETRALVASELLPPWNVPRCPDARVRRKRLVGSLSACQVALRASAFFSRLSRRSGRKLPGRVCVPSARFLGWSERLEPLKDGASSGTFNRGREVHFRATA